MDGQSGALAGRGNVAPTRRTGGKSAVYAERELTQPAWCRVVDLDGLTYRAEAVMAELSAT
jgi:hypothetical protein